MISRAATALQTVIVAGWTVQARSAISRHGSLLSGRRTRRGALVVTQPDQRRPGAVRASGGQGMACQEVYSWFAACDESGEDEPVHRATRAVPRKVGWR